MLKDRSPGCNQKVMLASIYHIAISARKMTPELPTDKLIKQRTSNSNDYITDLFQKKKYREYIINYLMRHYFVRNQDLHRYGR